MRDWLLHEVRDWLQADEEKLFLLSGDAGTGKSVLCDWITAEDGNEGAVLREVREAWTATYFCSRRHLAASTDPRAFIRDVSNQLSTRLPGFEQALLATRAPLVHGEAEATYLSPGASLTGVAINTLIVEGTSVQEVYQQALESPLQNVVARTGQRVTILIDGIDEGLDERSPTIGELAGLLSRVHPAVRLLLTSKNDRAALQPLIGSATPSYRHIDLSSDLTGDQVGQDIEEFARAVSPRRELRRSGLRRLRRVTQGNFIHAKGLLDAIELEGEAAIDSNELRPGLAAGYEQQLLGLMRRNFGEGWRTAWEESAANFFGVLAVAQEPLAANTIASYLNKELPSVEMIVDRFDQVLKSRGNLIWVHPTLASFLLSPSREDGPPNPFHVDAASAHLCIAERCLLLAAAPGEAPTIETRYALLHTQDHVAALCRSLLPEQAQSLVTSTFDAMIDSAFRVRLKEEVLDPLLLGRPYHRLAEILAENGNGDQLECLIAELAAAVEPALRAAALEALLLYARRQGKAALPFICRLALSEDPTPRLVALKGISRLGKADQVKALRRVVTRGGKQVRLSASYALYANWNTQPVALMSEVLLALTDMVAPYRPFILRPMLEFLASITITNYINNCGNQDVAELTSMLWRRIFHGRLHLNSLNRPLVERSLIVPIVARHFTERVLGGAIELSDGDRDLLPLVEEHRQRVYAAVAGLDPAVPFAPIANDVAFLAESDALIFRVLAAQVIAIRAMTAFPDLEEDLRRLFEGGSIRRRTTLLLALTVHLRDCPPWRALLEWMTEELISGETSPAELDLDPLLSVLDLLFVPLGLAYCRAGERLEMHERLIASTETAPTIRARCIAGTAIAGLYGPNLALAALEPAAEADEGFLERDGIKALGVMRSLHQAAVDRWIGKWGSSTLREAVLAVEGFETARRHMEAIGLYTNGVHQAIHYPIMRNSVLRGVFTQMAESGSLNEWAEGYTRTALETLRAADYTLINWTKA